MLMDPRKRNPTEAPAAPARPGARAPHPAVLDPTPPPDHDDFMESSLRGLHAVRERRERRRRKNA